MLTLLTPANSFTTFAAVLAFQLHISTTGNPRDFLTAHGSSSVGIFPSCIRPIREQRSASSRYDVETKIVIPSFKRSYRIFQKSRLETGSTPFVGSSRNSTSGV